METGTETSARKCRGLRINSSLPSDSVLNFSEVSLHSPPIFSFCIFHWVFSSSYFKVGAGAVPREGRILHSCKDSRYLPELGWSLICADPEGREEEAS